MSPLWAEFLGHFPKHGPQSHKDASVDVGGTEQKCWPGSDFSRRRADDSKKNTRLTVQTSLSKEYTLILMYKTSKQEMKHGNKIYVLFCSATCLEVAYNKCQSSLFCSVLFCWGSSHALGVRRRIHGGPVFNACNSGGNVAGATPTRLFVDLTSRIPAWDEGAPPSPQVDAGGRCRNDLAASDRGQDGGTLRAPLTRTPQQRRHGDKRTPRVSLVLFDTEVKYFIAAI